MKIPSGLLRGNDAELLHQAERIRDEPGLYEFTASDSVYFEPANRNPLPRWSDTSKCTLVSTSHSITNCYLVPFGNHIINITIKVWEGSEQTGSVLFRLLKCPVTRGTMVDVIGST